MTILNSKEIEPFRGLRLSDLELVSGMGIGRITLKRLQLKERELTKNGYGLPYSVAFQHHIKGITMKELQYELGVKYTPLVSIFDYYGIPRLTRSEAQKRSIEERGPPTKRFKSIRKKHEKFNKNRFSLTGQKRKEIIKAYDSIAPYRDIEGWEELVEEVSEKTGIKPEDIRIYFGKYFRKRY